MNFDSNSGIMGKLVQGGVILLGLLGAVIIGRMVAYENYQTLAMCVALGIGFVIYFLFSKYFWMICFASIFLPGSLPFLPLGLRPFEIFLLVGVVHFFIDQVVLEKKFLRVGIQPDGAFLCFALIIVIYHAAKDRLGVRMLGSDIWGGRAYLSILAGALGYFCLQAIRLDPKRWKKLPWIILLVAVSDLGIRLVTATSPRLADLISRFYTGVYMESPETNLSRWGFLGNFGYVALLTSLVISTIPGFIYRGKLIPPLLFALGLFGCLASGYRSSLIAGGVIVLLACLRDLRWKTPLLMLLGVLGLFGISFINTSIYRLPPGVQRGLVMLPGDWDPDLVRSAAGSDEFRWSVWKYWYQFYFPKHPLIGRGLGVPYEDILATLSTYGGVNAESGQAMFTYADRDDSFTATGNLHNGFLSVLDRFGILGGLPIFAFALIALKRFLGFILHNNITAENRPLQWIALYGSMWIICYPWGALRIDDFFGVLIILLGIFNSLSASMARPEEKPRPYEPLVIVNEGPAVQHG